MSYYVKEFEPSYKVTGPYKTIAEARRKVMNARFVDGGHIHKGSSPLCAYDTPEVGQVAHTYTGYRWMWVYVDANDRSYALNKDGTLGRRLRA